MNGACFFLKQQDPSISALHSDAPEDVVKFLVNVSYEATKDKQKRRKNGYLY